MDDPYIFFICDIDHHPLKQQGNSTAVVLKHM